MGQREKSGAALPASLLKMSRLFRGHVAIPPLAG